MPKGLIPAGIGLVWFHKTILKSNSKKTAMEKTEEGHIQKRETNKSSFKQNGFQILPMWPSPFSVHPLNSKITCFMKLSGHF